MKLEDPSKPARNAQTEREARQAEALRANLKRRKAAAGAKRKPQAIKNKETH
jgi:hypothetical protein